MKTLVAYFSASKTTEKAAKALAGAIDADLFEIQPAVPYTRADLDWTNKQSRSSLEMKDAASRPAIAKTCEQIGQYDTIYLGFPIWWYVAPTIIDTFLERYAFSGKTIIPFATSGGSDMGKTVEVLKTVCPNATWKKGGIVNGMTAADLAKWAEKQ